MEAGFSRMNDLTVVQSSQGLCAYLLETVPDCKGLGVVIGHDHRHHSEDFARLAAGVFLSKGIKTYYYRGLVHTPMVPFGVKVLKAACGIMITASHNPKADNGYKVYWGNGCQIIPPHDKLIADSINRPENQAIWSWNKTLVDSKDLKSESGEPLNIDRTSEMIDRYFAEVKTLCRHEAENASTSLKFVYTAMHGVGAPFAQRSFASFGFKEFLIVKEQVDPDPDFPTVAFPNPEEGKGALALAVATAEREGANLIFANDPDADRLAVAEKQRDGKWTIFSGNQIGVMLASYIWKNWKASNGDGDKVTMLASAVSSKMLERMAQVEGFHFVETLTGFKWLGNRAMDLEEEGKKKGLKVLFAYEEAIGFMVGDVVRDKDGVSSVACFAEFAAQLHKKGRLVGEYLDELYDRYGYFVSNNSYFICHHKPTIDRVFNKIRFGEKAAPSPDPRYHYALAYPTRVGGFAVTYICDLTIGYDSQQPDKKPLLPTSASSHMISFRLENGCYFTLRTSGTEPKVKYYVEMGGKAGQARSDVEAHLAKVVQGIHDMIEPEKNNFAPRPSE